MEYQCKTDEEIREIALSFRRGDLYTDRHLPPGARLEIVFMVFALMDRDGLREVAEFLDGGDGKTGLIYEELHRAPRPVNGHPCFLSAQYLSPDDMARMVAVVRRLEEAEQAALRG